MLPRILAGAVVTGLLACTGRADAQADKAACLKTYVEAQSRRQEGKLMAARAAAVVCGGDACPSVLRSDCVTWLRELDEAVPTVVFSASTPDGRDVTNARVIIDGRLTSERMTGEEVALDPGEHVVACEADGFTPVEIRLLAAQGVKNRPVHFVIEPVARPSRGLLSPTPARPVRPLTYVFGALGVVSVGVWAAFGVSAFWGSPSVETLGRCKPNCNPSDRQEVERKLLYADIAGGTALLALGGALILYVARPTIGPAAVRDGPLGTWVMRF